MSQSFPTMRKSRQSQRSRPQEFTFQEEEPDDDALRIRALSRQIPSLARQAAMDPGYGVEL